MKNILYFIVALGITACTKTYNVIPFEDGINEVNYTHKDKNQVLSYSLEQAAGYCSQRNKDFKVVRREQVYNHGVVNEEIDKNINTAIIIADEIFKDAPFSGQGIADAIGGTTTGKFLFRCVPMEWRALNKKHLGLCAQGYMPRKITAKNNVTAWQWDSKPVGKRLANE